MPLCLRSLEELTILKLRVGGAWAKPETQIDLSP